MKILFLAPYPHDQAGSQRFRFEQYAGVLREEGIKTGFGSFYGLKTWRILYQPGHTLRKSAGLLAGFLRRLLHLIRAIPYDYVFIHREITPVGPPVMEWVLARLMGKKIIYDFDDAIWLGDRLEPRWLRTLKWKGKIKWICRWAHRVSCGNTFLAEYAGRYNRDVVIMPTTIDTAATTGIRHQAATEHITIGWTGTHSTLPYLTPSLPVIREVLDAFPGTRLLIICNRRPDWYFEDYEFIEWNRSAEWTDLSRIDIGLMPLTDDEWSRGKCGFKILQYWALGLPALASPVGVNREMIDHGRNGFLCDTPGEWSDTLAKLIRDPALRQQVGQAGQETLTASFSLEANRYTFLGLFER